MKGDTYCIWFIPQKADIKKNRNRLLTKDIHQLYFPATILNQKSQDNWICWRVQQNIILTQKFKMWKALHLDLGDLGSNCSWILTQVWRQRLSVTFDYPLSFSSLAIKIPDFSWNHFHSAEDLPPSFAARYGCVPKFG